MIEELPPNMPPTSGSGKTMKVSDLREQVKNRYRIRYKTVTVSINDGEPCTLTEAEMVYRTVFMLLSHLDAVRYPVLEWEMSVGQWCIYSTGEQIRKLESEEESRGL